MSAWRHRERCNAGLKVVATIWLAYLLPVSCGLDEKDQRQCLETFSTTGGCPAESMKGACYSSKPGVPWSCMPNGLKSVPLTGCTSMGLPPPHERSFYEGYCSFYYKPTTSSTTTTTTTTPCPHRRLRIINSCWKEPIWIAHEAANGAIGPSPQNIMIGPGEHHDFCTPDKLTGTRYWPKMLCDEQGQRCLLGGSGGPGQGCSSFGYDGCAPPIDTKFEATFGTTGAPCNAGSSAGCDFIDVSLVDGWTLPFKLTLGGHCTGNGAVHPTEIDCSGLTFDVCPTKDELAGSKYDLKARHWGMGSVTGCYSPCLKMTDAKWNNTAASGHTRTDKDVAPYCCPTPPISPEACRNGPIEKTEYVKAVHRYCHGVYGYAYDDAMGLLQCSADTYYTLEFFCPSTMPSWDYVWVTTTSTSITTTASSITQTSTSITYSTRTTTSQTSSTHTTSTVTVTSSTTTSTTVSSTTSGPNHSQHQLILNEHGTHQMMANSSFWRSSSKGAHVSTSNVATDAGSVHAKPTLRAAQGEKSQPLTQTGFDRRWVFISVAASGGVSLVAATALLCRNYALRGSSVQLTDSHSQPENSRNDYEQLQS